MAQTGRTTIEIVRQQQYNVEALHGIKRSHDQIDPVTVTPKHSAFQDILSAKEAFKRQRLHAGGKNRIEASKICSLTSGPDISISQQQPSKQISTALPGPSQNPLLSLTHPRYSLPQRLVRNFASLGINSIYPWQSSCLLGRGLLTGEKNLVYTAPTGGGKSLVADVLMLKRVTEDPTKKAILVLPYVALVQEKLKWLRKAVEGVKKQANVGSQTNSQLPAWRRPHSDSVRVVGFFGGSKARASWSDTDIAICTFEKANALINTAIENCTINDLGILVLDELHMIDDDHRGYLMELMASKVLSLERPVQIVGMSATLTNTEILAKWLNARYYSTKYVPVPIEEYLVYDCSIYPVSTSSAFFKATSQLSSSQHWSGASPARMIQESEHKELKDPSANAVVSLAVETAKAGFGALIFCSGRQGCQSTASLVSETMPELSDVNEELLDHRRNVISELRSLPVGLDDTLDKTVMKGVAFHHAGLTVEERDIVAEAYDKGIISVIVATCSLAAGINLPARRVILQGARMGRELVGPAMLRQMRGRAGRKGKDEIGESYLCCKKADLEEVAQLLEADLPMVESGLTPQKRGIKRALLEVITVRLATHMAALHEYVQKTLLYHTMDRVALDNMVSETLQELIECGLITRDEFGSYEASLLSQATVASFLTPEDGIFLHGELRRALQAFVMDGEMHIFYTFTPLYNPQTDINWPIFRRELESLDESGMRVLKYVGVNPGLVNRM